MLKVGPNPYGLCCTLGFQGKLENPKGLDWFLALAEGMHARCVELHFEHLRRLSPEDLEALRRRLVESTIEPVISAPWPLARVPEALPIAAALGAKTVRTHLAPVLCGARAELGDAWPSMVADVRTKLVEFGPMFAIAGLSLAIENHQDFGSEELIEFCEIGGPGLGICFDTGNALAVGEDPIGFAERVAPKVRHVHLKDYRTYATPEGFRLVRCAIGDGAIPFPAIEKILSLRHKSLTAALEPGALDNRHVKLLTESWWNGYRSRTPQELSACLTASKVNEIPQDEDWRTPWERGEDARTVSRFETDQMMKSVQNMQGFGWLP